MRQKFLASFPIELLNHMVSIREPDEVEIAWTSEVVEKVIYYLMKNNAAILGGRVFGKSDGNFYFTGLEWDTKGSTTDWNTLVQKSAEKALSFLKKDYLPDSEYVYVLDVVGEEDMMMRNRLPQHFPRGLMEGAYLLDCVGSAEIAWKYEAVISVVKFYAANEYVILGGDVYEIRNEHIRPTLDNWYFSSKNPYSQEDISLSSDKAILYIENYYLKNGDGYGYTLVVRPLKQ